jgi:hypothetical protein
MRVEQCACTPLSGTTSPVYLKWLRLPDQKWLCFPNRYHVSHFRGLSFPIDNVAKIEKAAAANSPLHFEPEP